MIINRSNVEEMLDNGSIFVRMGNGNWWRLRRNGKTQTWKTDADRIRIPTKAGLKATGAITEADFVTWGSEPHVLDPSVYLHENDVPAKGRR